MISKYAPVGASNRNVSSLLYSQSNFANLLTFEMRVCYNTTHPRTGTRGAWKLEKELREAFIITTSRRFLVQVSPI